MTNNILCKIALKMSVLRLTNTAGVSIIAFIVAVSVSLAYYQFFYIPEANKRPIISEDVLNPASSVTVTIVEGSANPDQERNYVPKQVRGMLGVDNKIVWVNEDTTFHSVKSDNGFEDRINGKFDSMSTIGLVEPGGTWEFTFTETGEHQYHCEPHPWMKGVVMIVENFA
jgi:plastocyanin